METVIAVTHRSSRPNVAFFPGAMFILHTENDEEVGENSETEGDNDFDLKKSRFYKNKGIRIKK